MDSCLLPSARDVSQAAYPGQRAKRKHPRLQPWQPEDLAIIVYHPMLFIISLPCRQRPKGGLAISVSHSPFAMRSRLAVTARTGNVPLPRLVKMPRCGQNIFTALAPLRGHPPSDHSWVDWP